MREGEIAQKGIGIPVVLFSDGENFIPACVTIASVISSKRDSTAYDIYVVCFGLSRENESVLTNFNSETVTTHIIRENVDIFQSQSAQKLTTATLLKFALPEILVGQDKIIYLESDVLVEADLSELYEIDLGNDLVAAVGDVGMSDKAQPAANHFDQGVMVLNLAQMRAEHVMELLGNSKEERNSASSADQCAFNSVCVGRVKLLPARYNGVASSLDKVKSKQSKEQNQDCETTQNSQTEEARIVHFAPGRKPWDNPFVYGAKKWFELYRNIQFPHTIPDYPKLLANTNITVSLTSYPARINSVIKVIDCLSNQTVSPNRVVLYLAKERFEQEHFSLPEELVKQVEQNKVEIHWCEKDVLRPHNKYFYAMQEYPEDIIINVDDDLYLPTTLVEELVLGWLHHPKTVIARRVHLITFDGEHKILPYQSWILEYDGLLDVPSMQLLATGVGGVLYPPHILKQPLFDSQAIIENAQCADDLWLKAHEAMQNIPVVLVAGYTKPRHVEETQHLGLYHENLTNNRNDVYLKNICSYMDNLYGEKNILQRTLYQSSIGQNLVGAGPLVALINGLKSDRYSINKKLHQTQKQSDGFKKKLTSCETSLRLTTKKLSEVNKKLSASLSREKALESSIGTSLGLTTKKLSEVNKKLSASLSREKALKSSISFRIGRCITWLPRKLRDGVTKV